MASFCGSSVEPARRASNVKMVFDLTKHTISEMVVRSWSACGQWPGVSVVVLVSTEDVNIALEWVAFFAKDWEVLTRWEKAWGNKRKCRSISCFFL